MIRIAIVEDNITLRNSLEKLINNNPVMECTSLLGNLNNVVLQFLHNKPDIVLMDIGLPGISGIEGVKTVKHHFPEIQVLMFTVFDDDEKIFEAIREGASGYLLKKTPPEEIAEAILQLHQGGAPMSPSIARKVIQAFQKQPVSGVSQFELTPREKEILNALVEGMSYKKIADTFFLSISTVRTHINNIYQKLHVNSKSQAVAKVLQK